MNDPPAPRRKQRLLARLGRQLVIHVNTVSLLCYIAGVIAVLLLPLLAKPTYISENALMPGSGNPMFGMSDTFDARASAVKMKFLVSERGGQRALSRWLVERMGVFGADCYLHPFFADSAVSHRFLTPPMTSHWSTSNSSSSDHLEMVKGAGINFVGIIRAPQGEGNEAIVLVTPFNEKQFGQEDALTLGVGLALFARLSKALWIARDVIWLVADAKYGAYSAVSEWLREYHEPETTISSAKAKLKLDLLKQFMDQDGQLSGENHYDETFADFKRAGTIATGLVFDLKAAPGETVDVLKLRAEGPNGQMPNLDLINIINSIAVWRESLSIELEVLPSLKRWAWLSYVGYFLEGISNLAKQISPSWDFASAAASYPRTLATLLSSMFVQVTGLPTGAHGAFRDYQIDAVSLQFPAPDAILDYPLTKFGRLLEGVLRSVNNLLEKWHQSFFLYFLSAPHKYISVGVYMQPFALLLISLPLTAAALCFPAKEAVVKDGNKDPFVVVAENDKVRYTQHRGPEEVNSDGQLNVNNSGIWLQALLLISTVQMWAFFAALMLTLIARTNWTADLKLSSWLVTVAVSLWISLVLYNFLVRLNNPGPLASQGGTEFWLAVKALTMGVTSIGLAVMSTVNYPVALIGALILVPMCLGVLPLGYGWKCACRPGKGKLAFVPFTLGVCLVLLGSPLGIAGFIRIFCANHWDISPSNIWYVTESLLTWDSALLPYFLVIHLPCSVLCIYILVWFETKEPKCL